MPLSDYDIVIGLEIHVQLKTASKMFCSCRNTYGATPNTHTCPVCLGLPGALPVINKQAVNLGIRAGLSFNCEISRVMKFDRKNYFYPDLPKGYQITQYDIPINGKGHIVLELADGTKKHIGITRAHLEEDTGKNFHDTDLNASLVDYNRCGIPLLEIVSEPDMSSAEEGQVYLLTLKKILEFAEISDCDMEKGQMRCDANISLKKKGTEKLGTLVEVKNMNSINHVRQALEFEARRQAIMLDAGEKITQETRGWRDLPEVGQRKPEFKDIDGETVPQRSKEQAHDYRYFPEPDLGEIEVSQAWIDEVQANLPENPFKRKERYMNVLELSEYNATVLTNSKQISDFFEQCLAKFPEGAKNIVDIIKNHVMTTVHDHKIEINELPIPTDYIAELAKLRADDKLNNQTLKKLYEIMLEEKESPAKLGEKHNLFQAEADESELEDFVMQAFAQNEHAVQDALAGKKNAQNAIMGWVMKTTNRKYKPQQILPIIAKKLEELK